MTVVVLICKKIPGAFCYHIGLKTLELKCYDATPLTSVSPVLFIFIPNLTSPTGELENYNSQFSKTYLSTVKMILNLLSFADLVHMESVQQYKHSDIDSACPAWN